jgi:hypothetical protein
MVTVVTAVAVVLGLVLRLWYLLHVPTNADEAIVGFMANGILHGHFFAFYWGQAYGGGEPYVVAVMFFLFGHSAFVLGLTGVLLSAITAILTWRAARRLVRFRELAALTGALVWVIPDAAVSNSTREFGFRGVTMVCGVACVLLALRLLDGYRSWPDVCALGLFAGLGWWSSPEIAYFLLPAGLMVVGAVVSDGQSWRWWVPRVAAAVAAFFVGALPWLWANAQSGFASLKPSSFPNSAITTLNTGFWGRLNIFGRLSLPIGLDLRRLGSGTFLFGGTGAGLRHALGAGVTVVVLVLTGAAVVFCALRGGRWLAMAATVLAFPFLFAGQPGTWFWSDGRYIVFLGPLLALNVAPGLEELTARLAGNRSNAVSRGANLATLTLGAALVMSMVLALFALAGDNQTSVSALASGWGNPNAPVDRAITTLQAAGVQDGFADYWVAYKLDFLSNQTLVVTPAKGDVDRQKDFDRQVAAAPQQAWIFVPPSQTEAGFTQFSATSTIAGPDGIPEQSFVNALRVLKVPYRVVPAGILTAVVPARKVTVGQVQAAGA